MLRFKVILVVAISVGGILLAGCEGDTILADQKRETNQICVFGQGTVKGAPDLAQAQVGVQTFAESVELALAENNTKAEGVLAALFLCGGLLIKPPRMRGCRLSLVNWR